MRLVIFGASGRVGRLLVEQALTAGHTVTAFVRDPASLSLQHEQLRVMQGDVVQAQAVAAAIAGQEAVMSALGHSSSSSRTLLETGVRHIVAGMQASGVKRLVSLTGAGVRAPQDQPKLIDHATRALLALLSGAVLKDAEAQARVIEASGLDWVIVRAPRLVDGPQTGRYRVGYVGKDSGVTISRGDVADFLLKQVTDTTYLHELPLVSY